VLPKAARKSVHRLPQVCWKMPQSSYGLGTGMIRGTTMLLFTGLVAFLLGLLSLCAVSDALGR
jgi:hypothetical protein